MGADRILAVAAYDGAGPRALGRFSARFGTPLTVNILSGIVSTADDGGGVPLRPGQRGKYFSAAIALAISTETLAYLAIFPGVHPAADGAGGCRSGLTGWRAGALGRCGCAAG